MIHWISSKLKHFLCKWSCQKDEMTSYRLKQNWQTACDPWLASRYMRYSEASTLKTKTKSIRWCSKDIKRHPNEEDTDANKHEDTNANKHIKECLTSLATGEIQINTTMRYHY